MMRTKRVLVVDDEHLVRWFLDRALKKSGFEVVTASGIAEALALLREGTFELLFLDLRMPDGGGLELLKKMEGIPQGMKVVVCSAFVTDELEEEFGRRGIRILRKPFKLDELEAVVKACLEG